MRPEDLPSLYILRKPSDELPKFTVCKPGDTVVMHSGDIMVHDGQMWYLLPGRYLDTEQLKLFVRYIASGWPSDPFMVRDDLAELENERFLDEMVKVCERLNNSPKM